MPAASGVDPPTDIRLSSNFFRCAGREWLPQSVDDPLFPSAVYVAGREYGWSLREFCIVRTLFESGARISEVIGLTAADWAVSRFLNQFSARNKGSLGIRTKRLVISHGLANLYRRYFDDAERGRLACDPHHHSVHDLQKVLKEDPNRLSSIPLFLTERGTPMSILPRRDHEWGPLLVPASCRVSAKCGRDNGGNDNNQIKPCFDQLLFPNVKPGDRQIKEQSDKPEAKNSAHDSGFGVRHVTAVVRMMNHGEPRKSCWLQRGFEQRAGCQHQNQTGSSHQHPPRPLATQRAPNGMPQ
jgi:hypothetical protein